MLSNFGFLLASTHLLALMSGLTRNETIIIEEFARSMKECHHHTGLLLAATSKGSVALNLAYGFRDVVKQTKMSPDTKINIGSISMAFTGRRNIFCSSKMGDVFLC